MRIKPYYPIETTSWRFSSHPDVMAAKNRSNKGANTSATNEEYVRQWFLNELIETYRYPKEWLGERLIIEESVKMGSSSKQADISLKNKGYKTYLFVETANSSIKQNAFQEKLLNFNHIYQRHIPQLLGW